jgi:hypothetical protein
MIAHREYCWRRCSCDFGGGRRQTVPGFLVGLEESGGCGRWFLEVRYLVLLGSRSVAHLKNQTHT